MSTFSKDVLVVGQGIAGTCLSFLLESQGKTFDVIERKIPISSSQAAAGIMNPITGKFFSLSWQYPELYPIAIDMYAQMASLLGLEVSFDKKIYRTLKSAAQENEWLYRASQEKYAPYMSDQLQAITTGKLQLDGTSIARVDLGIQVPIAQITEHWNVRLKSRSELIESTFNFDHLTLHADGIQYLSMQYTHVIFCDGAFLTENPYFKYLPMQPAKGEAILIHAPDLDQDDIVKEDVFIAPWHHKDYYWIGATYAWNPEDANPSIEKQSYLESELKRILKVPYTVESRLAGIRPAVKDRKPLVGVHPDYPQIALLNGLGTKGTSLGPFAAKALYDRLYHNIELPPEIDIRRFH